RTRQQRDEGTTGRIRTPSAAIEVHRHSAASTGVLEEAQILLRRPEEDRHLIERHAGRGLVEEPTNDLDRFASLARRRKEPDVAGTRPFSGTVDGEDVPAQLGE